ncbi:hypothetical protein E2P81_ATG08541 [Venturia nashicola]|nr:hypothetical protein E2P81_ATG08541 [Venturia nashicola]
MSPKPLQTIAVNLEKATLCGEKVSRSATWTTLPPYTYLEACTNANQCSSPLEMKPDLKCSEWGIWRTLSDGGKFQTSVSGCLIPVSVPESAYFMPLDIDKGIRGQPMPLQVGMGFLLEPGATVYISKDCVFYWVHKWYA